MKKILSISPSLCITLLAALFQLFGSMLAMEQEQMMDEKDKELLQAVSENKIDQVQKLLVQGAHTYIQDKDGYTPLHVAIVHGHQDVAQLLVNSGAPLSFGDEKNGDTPLHATLREIYQPECLGNQMSISLNKIEKQPAMVKLLLAHDANPSIAADDGKTPLHVAAFLNRTDVVQLLKDAEKVNK